ncbi:hypothetical protein P607_09560 [Comamonas thiooxydans]|nr:hypothetical protein P607_09560 [Comamonas thiooxydans]
MFIHLHQTWLKPCSKPVAISSSVIAAQANSLIRSKVNMTCVENDNKRTKDFAIDATQAMECLAMPKPALNRAARYAFEPALQR